MPMYGSGYIFSKQFFTGWVVVGIIWIFCSLFAVGLFPVFEGRKTLAYTVKAIFLDVTGKKHPGRGRNHPPLEGQPEEHSDHGSAVKEDTKTAGLKETSGTVTPTEKR